MRSRVDELTQAGCTIAVVGSGWPAAAKDFAGKSRLPEAVPVLCDQERRSFALLALKRSIIATLFSLRALKRFLQLRREGFKQGRTQGDPWQQGGAVLVTPEGNVAYRFASAAPDDAVPFDAVLVALRGPGSPRARAS